MTIFGNGEFDRSPCGTGTTTRMACLYADVKMYIGDLLLHENMIGTVFEGRILSHVRIGGYRAVIPEIYGNTYVTLYLSWRIPRLVQPISKRVLNYSAFASSIRAVRRSELNNDINLMFFWDESIVPYFPIHYKNPVGEIIITVDVFNK